MCRCGVVSVCGDCEAQCGLFSALVRDSSLGEHVLGTSSAIRAKSFLK